MCRKEEATATSEEYPDEDIVQSVLALKEPANQDADDVDNSTVPIIPTYQQFLAAEEILTLLNTMEKTCQRKREDTLKQSTLDHFLTGTLNSLHVFYISHVHVYNYVLLC